MKEKKDERKDRGREEYDKEGNNKVEKVKGVKILDKRKGEIKQGGTGKEKTVEKVKKGKEYRKEKRRDS